MRKIIAFTGLARSGKDTATSFLVQQGFRRLAFADTVKDVASTISFEPLSYYHRDDLKEEFSEAWNMTRRQAMQKLGHGMRTMFHDSVWINNLLKRMDGLDGVVISDLRYDNEAEALKNAGATIIRIVRPGHGLQGAEAAHPTEQGISDEYVDVEILNDGTLDDLKAHVLAAVRVYAGGAE